jgi:hypothetical protein
MRTIYPSAPPRRPRTLIAVAAACAALVLPALPAAAAVAGQAALVTPRAAQAPPPQEMMIKGSVTINDVYAYQTSYGETFKETSALTVTVLMQSQTDAFGNVDWVDAGGAYDAAFTYKDAYTTKCPSTTTANTTWSGRFGGTGATDGTIRYFPPGQGGPLLYANVPDAAVTYKKTDCNGTSSSQGRTLVRPNCTEAGLPGVFTASGTNGAGKLAMACDGHTVDEKWTVTGTLAVLPACAPPYQPSGAAWGSQFPGSSSVSDLASGFRQHVDSFIAAMRAAGIKVRSLATYRPYERSYLMHFSWLIAHGMVSAQKVPPFDPPAGATDVTICWAHYKPDGSYDKAASVAAAKATLAALGVDPTLGVAPPLQSNHNKKLAIDMTTTWTGTVTVKNGQGHNVVIATTPRTALNAKLMAVGQSYGVIHFCLSGCATKTPKDDANHWSVNGH